MFASNASKVNFVPENGMQVVLKASVSVFEASGSVQLYVREMIPYGTGNLALKFEQLKKQLHEEGLFNDNYKKNLPKYPMDLAVVSGQNSAALSDIKTTLKRRWPIAKVKIYNTLVQGSSAHLDIIENLKNADLNNHNLIILARGGGSIEDLWPFNEELLAREIFKLKTPIISGVGHEVDFTISDFVSDLRAPTPTAAAELATPDINEVLLNVNNLNIQLKSNMEAIVNTKMLQVDFYRSSANFKHPEIILNKAKSKLEQSKLLLNNYKQDQLKMIRDFEGLANDFKNKTQKVISRERLKLNNLDNQINTSIQAYNRQIRSDFLRQIQLMDSYSPINTLKRGYSIVEKEDEIINSVKTLNVNDSIKLVMHDGSVSAKVLEKRLNNEWIWLWKSNKANWRNQWKIKQWKC